MKKYFASLSSFERRFVVGALLIVFVVLNLIFVRPLFSDWGKYQERGFKARRTLKNFQDKIALVPELERRVKAMESEGAFVPPEDQANDFIRTIQQQQVASGVDVKSSVPQSSPRTNTFFLERVQALTLEAGEPQLVDFLYRLGAGNSLVRVRGLSLRRDVPGVRLSANVTLVASCQKKPAAKPATITAPVPAPTSTEQPKPVVPVATERPKPSLPGTDGPKPGPTVNDKPKPVPTGNDKPRPVPTANDRPKPASSATDSSRPAGPAPRKPSNPTKE